MTPRPSRLAPGAAVYKSDSCLRLQKKKKKSECRAHLASRRAGGCRSRDAALSTAAPGACGRARESLGLPGGQGRRAEARGRGRERDHAGLSGLAVAGGIS